jgi:hypothetical protein
MRTARWDTVSDSFPFSDVMGCLSFSLSARRQGENPKGMNRMPGTRVFIPVLSMSAN